MIVNPGVFTSIRQAYLRSRNIDLWVCVYITGKGASVGGLLSCHAVLDDSAVEEMHGPISMFRKTLVVRNHANRRAGIM